MTRTSSTVTPERFSKGMTFDEYVAYIGTPANLAREGSMNMPRRDLTEFMRAAYEGAQLSPAQADALRWLSRQPGGPAKILAIAEEWSSDCRRDIPTLQRVAEAGGMELRIFPRDGAKFSASHHPTLADAPDSNADIMAEFLNHKNGQTWQSIPVIAFYASDLAYLYHYTEFPAIYDKDRIVYGHIRKPRPGETPADTQGRIDREFPALQASPFFRVWASAAVDEMISALHRRLLLGAAPSGGGG